MTTCNKVIMHPNIKIDEGLSLIILALDVCTLKTKHNWYKNIHHWK